MSDHSMSDRSAGGLMSGPVNDSVNDPAGGPVGNRSFASFVALGDSFTEGLNDPGVDGHFRGCLGHGGCWLSRWQPMGP